MDLIETVKTAMQVADKFKDLSLKQALADVREKTVEQQGELIEVKQENLSLKEENKKLKESLRRQGNYRKGNGHLWEVKDNKVIDGPFCITCWERRQEILTLVKAPRGSDVMCPVCKNFMMPHIAPNSFDK